MPSQLQHNYQARLMELLQRRELPITQGKGHILTVRHDDDCPIFQGGICRCNPDFEIREV